MANPKLTDAEVEQLIALREKTRRRYKKQNESKQRLYDIVTVTVPKGVKDIWKAEANIENKSLTQFVSDAVENYIDNK